MPHGSRTTTLLADGFDVVAASVRTFARNGQLPEEAGSRSWTERSGGWWVWRLLACGWILLGSWLAWGTLEAAGQEGSTGGPNRSAVTSLEALKAKAVDAVNESDTEGWQAALKIWNWAELGYQEQKSSRLLSDLLESRGFRVTRGVANIPTAFTAEFGSGKPVIGILGEYDALPGLSQKATAQQEPAGGIGGHGCGHHVFGAASMLAAWALAEQIRQGELQGTVRFYGCPAEEGGSAKVFMVQAGLFADCDAVLHWHPASQNGAGDRQTLARNAVKFRFHGQSAHAAGAPEQGRSALDAVELTNHAAQLLREHTPDGTRIHHVVTAGGSAPNVVPDFAEVYYYIRHPEAEVVRKLYQRLLKCAQAGALATETRLDVRFEGGVVQILPNHVLGEVCLRNLRQQNDLKYTEETQQFATRIQQTLAAPLPLDSIQEVADHRGAKGRGSTDVGDVSWVVPTTGFTTVCFVPGTPGHSWQAVASGATEVGHLGMNLAARVLATTAVDLMTTPSLLAAAQAELKQRLGSQPYQSLMEEGQQPPLDYRQPAQAR